MPFGIDGLCAISVKQINRTNLQYLDESFLKKDYFCEKYISLMKQFLKMTLAVVLGIAIAVFVLFSVLSGLVTAMTAFDTAAPVPSKAVLDLDMSRLVVSEQTASVNPLETLAGGAEIPAQIGLWDAVNAINAAAEDSRISYILLRSDALSLDASIAEELRSALASFRTSGKPVLAYIENPTSLSYYLASVADKLYMTPHAGSMININGVSSSMIYLKDLLDKLGVNVQLIRHGKYKSAGEPFIRSTPSAEALEQSRSMVCSMWGSLAQQISKSRGVSVARLNEMIDNLELVDPQDMLDNALVDELLSLEQLRNKIADIAMVDSYSKVQFVNLSDYSADIKIKEQAARTSGSIAVIYADGQIIDGRANQEVAGDRFAALVHKLANDDKVKAVVLRVNSPGGSVLASEKIKAELDSLKADKPLIASYGAYAASGGYWISNNCDKIYSDALTLTGSIGVFSMIPDLSRTIKDKAHLNVVNVNSNKHGDMLSLSRPFDKDEYRYMQAPVEEIYNRFVTVVSEGRNLSPKAVDKIGQGRVWTGSQALEIGLVDEIGGLEEAIRYAAALAGEPELSQWSVEAYPKPQTLVETLMSLMGGGTDIQAEMLNELKTMKESRLVARIPYQIKFNF